jgi:hypothetical protein
VNGTGQGGWGRVPDSLTTDAPATAADDSGLLLVVRRRDGQLYVNRYGTEWNGWSRMPSLPVASIGAPSVNLRWRVYVRSTNNNVYRNISVWSYVN